MGFSVFFFANSDILALGILFLNFKGKNTLFHLHLTTTDIK